MMVEPHACSRKAWPMLLGIFSLMPLGPASASDAEFSRALTAVGCAPTQVTVTRKAQDLQIYKVTCTGNPPRVVGMSCVKNKCSVSSSREPQELGSSSE